MSFINKDTLLKSLEKLFIQKSHEYASIMDIADTYRSFDKNISKHNSINYICEMLSELNIHTSSYLIKKMQDENVIFSNNMYKNGVFDKQSCDSLINNCKIIDHINSFGDGSTLINSISRMPVILSDLLSEYRRYIFKDKDVLE